MIEYLLKFTNEAAAKAELSDWLITDEEGVDHWRPKPQCGILPTNLVVPAKYDKNGVKTKAQVVQAGFYIVISLPQRSPE